MSRRLDLGDYHVGPYCGARLWSPRDWRTYGLFRSIGNGFSVGPLLFWRERIEPPSSRSVRYRVRRIRFLWRLGNGLAWRIACILGLRRSPSWDAARPWELTRQ